MPRRRAIKHVGGSLALGAPLSAATAATTADPSLSPGAGSFSIRVPCRVSSLAVASHLIAAFANYNVDGWLINQYGPTLIIYAKSGAGAYSVGGVFRDTSWHVLHVVFDASTHSITAYMDGVSLGAAASAWSGAFNANAALSFNYGGSNSPGGNIADVVYAVGTAWTAADVAADYFDAKTPPGVTHAWPLDDGAGLTARATLGGLPLALSGGAAFSADSPCLARGIVRNVIAQSERLDLSPWTLSHATPSAYGGPLPTGVTSMRVLSDDAVAGLHYAYQGNLIAVGQQYIVSAHVAKVVGAGFVALQVGAGLVYFNVTTGQVGTINAAALSYGIDPTNVAGIYRCYVRAIATAANQYADVLVCNGDNGASYAGPSQQVAVGGVQVEIPVPGQTTPSPYVPTGATPLSVYGKRETRQNGFTNSEDFSKATWNKTGCSFAPGSGALVEDGSTGVHRVFNTVTQPFFLPGKPMTVAVEATAGVRRYLAIEANDGDTTWAIYDLQTGAVTYQGASVLAAYTLPLGGGKWICVYTLASALTAPNLSYSINASAVPTHTNATLDPYTGTNGATALTLGKPRVCQGYGVSDYITTTTAPANPNGAPRQKAA
jgi:hypothetical protein